MEEMFYIKTNKSEKPRKLFVHALFNENKEGVFVLFFNPFLDRIAEFSMRYTQVQIARMLNSQNINTIHFDYYGTGDSDGELYEIDFNKSIDDIQGIINYIKTTYVPSKIILFGIRFGADIALQVSQRLSEIDNLVLYEPVVDGKYFYKSKKYIVKSNHLLWNINPEMEIEINNKKYEDFDGIPISEELRNYICNLKSDELDVSGKNILIFNLDTSKQTDKVDFISNKKHIESFIEKHKQKNRLKVIKLDLSEGQNGITRQTALTVTKFAILVGSQISVGA